MRNRRYEKMKRKILFPMFFLLSLAACDRNSGNDQTRQTKFPGQVSAGGGTSGEVMARNSKATAANTSGGTPSIPQGAGGNTGGTAQGGAVAGSTPSGQEGVRGQTPGGTGVSGTPGIPEGAGGNPSGAAMGGTTPGAAGTQIAPPQTPTPEKSVPQAPSSGQATSGEAPQQGKK